MINNHLNIGFGVNDFSKLKETSFYIDKTLLIKDFINEKFYELFLV